MLTAFSTALSALHANETGVNVVGNNLANLNTPGFKGSTSHFSDLMQSMGTGGAQAGMGTARVQVFRQFSQGAIQMSGGAMDAAVEGNGFFVVRASNGEAAFTRAGNFRVDAAGNLVTNGGHVVQGWNAVGGVIDTGGPAGNIVLPGIALFQPAATTKISAALNLNASAADGATFSTPIQVVDSLGGTHVVTITFTKDSANTWTYKATIPGDEVTAGTPGQPFELPVSGTLTFDRSGRLTSPDESSPSVIIDIAGLTNGAADLNIEWALYDAVQTPLLTQFVAPSATSATTQNGVMSGHVTAIGMADEGKIVARYSNGQTVEVAQLALAAIRNPETLIAAGGNLLLPSPETAEPVIGVAETSGRGKIVGGALESSTVDIAREFTNLIQYQRSYQANARVIQTADNMSQEVVNLTR